MANKRGAVESETVHVTGLVILIALLITLYMVLIPPEAQKQILEKGQISDSENSVSNSQDVLKNLLIESPGLVFPDSNKEEKIKIPSVNLYSKQSKNVINLANSLSVSRSIFNNNFQDLSFKSEDISNLNSLKLFFNVLSSKGTLVIYLNNIIVFQGIVSNENVPLEIPISNIKSDNILRMEASSPSWRFLSLNQYTLKDIKLIKETVSTNNQETRHFTIDKDKIKKAALNYFINCLKLENDQGILKIFLNGFNVHLGQVICDASEQNLDISKSYFTKNENTLSFESDKGNYVVEQIEVAVQSDSSKTPIYFFDVDNEDLSNTIMLNMDLIPNEDDERSSGTIIINDQRITLETDKNIFSKDISSLIKEGENFVKIIPRNEFEISSLEIFIK